MLDFNKILSSELPSKNEGSFFESEDFSAVFDDDSDSSDSGFETEGGCGSSKNEGCSKSEGCSKTESDDWDDDDSYDPDDDCEQGEDCDPFDDNDDDEPAPIKPAAIANTEVKDLDQDAEDRIDDTLDAVATPILLGESTTEDEYERFIESADCDILIDEGYLTERTIVKFDKDARRSQLFEVAVFACAREHNDKLFNKLQTVYKMERVLKAKLRKKYKNEANRKVKEYLQRSRNSKSSIFSKIANKFARKK